MRLCRGSLLNGLKEVSGRQSQKTGVYDRSFRVDNQGYLHAKYYNEELKSSNKLNTNEFAHVAMVLNSESGFSIYINGNRVAHESSPKMQN